MYLVVEEPQKMNNKIEVTKMAEAALVKAGSSSLPVPTNSIVSLLGCDVMQTKIEAVWG